MNYPPTGYTRVTTATTTQAVSKACWVGFIHVHVVGVGATIDIYDATSGTSNKIWSWATADGKKDVELGIRLKTGLRIITAGGTPCELTITHSE